MQRIPAAGRIDTARIDVDALKVIRRLRQFGYEAFLVGGSVRDLWLGRTPKDFDIATSASPRQIKRVFSNCRLIGRRFRLAHVFFGRKILEVSTFRALVAQSDEPADEVDEDAPEQTDLIVWDDNVFGNAEEDALRRDFTVNGLFYDPETEEVIDYVDGIADIERKIIRTIGDPGIRMREDPVRILRAVKFASRLDFEIEAATYEACVHHASEILLCSQARVNEEIMRLLSSGHAAGAVRLMWEIGVLEHLLPDLADYLAAFGKQGEDRLWRTLRALDELERDRHPITGGIVIGAAFWPVIEAEMEDPSQAALDYGLRVDHAVGSVTQKLRLPRRESALLKQVLIARRRLLSDAARKRRTPIGRMRGKAYFAGALAFCEMEMRAAGRTPEEVEAWRAQYVGPDRAEGHAAEPGAAQPAAHAAAHPEESGGEQPGGPRKRRRRRRRRGPRPGGGGEGTEPGSAD